MRSMKHTQSGFTLIELVIVIVILGVLAALAVPRFVNLQDDAQKAALSSNANALTSSVNVNFAACSMKNHVVDTECIKVDNCDKADDLLTGGALSTGYSITAAAIAANGTSVDCTLTGPTGTVTFKAIGAGI